MIDFIILKFNKTLLHDNYIMYNILKDIQVDKEKNLTK